MIARAARSEELLVLSAICFVSAEVERPRDEGTRAWPQNSNVSRRGLETQKTSAQSEPALRATGSSQRPITSMQPVPDSGFAESLGKGSHTSAPSPPRKSSLQHSGARPQASFSDLKCILSSRASNGKCVPTRPPRRLPELSRRTVPGRVCRTPWLPT